MSTQTFAITLWLHLWKTSGKQSEASSSDFIPSLLLRGEEVKFPVSLGCHWHLRRKDMRSLHFHCNKNWKLVSHSPPPAGLSSPLLYRYLPPSFHCGPSILYIPLANLNTPVQACRLFSSASTHQIPKGIWLTAPVTWPGIKCSPLTQPAWTEREKCYNQLGCLLGAVDWTGSQGWFGEAQKLPRPACQSCLSREGSPGSQNRAFQRQSWCTGPKPSSCLSPHFSSDHIWRADNRELLTSYHLCGQQTHAWEPGERMGDRSCPSTMQPVRSQMWHCADVRGHQAQTGCNISTQATHEAPLWEFTSAKGTLSMQLFQQETWAALPPFLAANPPQPPGCFSCLPASFHLSTPPPTCFNLPSSHLVSGRVSHMQANEPPHTITRTCSRNHHLWHFHSVSAAVMSTGHRLVRKVLTILAFLAQGSCTKGSFLVLSCWSMRTIKNQMWRLPWQSSVWKSACSVGDRSWILVQEDSTCCRAAKRMSDNYWNPCTLEPMLHNKRSHCNEKPMYHN